MSLVTRARVRAAAAVALVVLVASACAGPTAGSGSDAPSAVVAGDADCLAPQVLDELGLRLDPGLAARSSHAAAPATGRVPDDFVPAGVLVCQVGGQMRDGQGTWTAVTATSREGTAADVAGLVGTIRDELATTGGTAAAPAAKGTCGPDDRPVVLWLLDAIGRAMRPAVPVDGCGAPRPAVLTALDRLPVTGVVDHPVELVAPTH